MNERKVVETLLQTQRLDLHHLCVEDLVTLYKDPENLLIYLGKPFSNPHRVLMDDQGPLAWRVPEVEKNPELNRWFVRWIVLRTTGEIIGSTSFHAAPDANGMIEIGLGISEAFRNKGYARESLLGMWLWALDDPQVKILRYTVGVENSPSIRVINSFGFMYRGEQIDEEDGPESIYEMSREEFLSKYKSHDKEIEGR